MAVLEAKIAVLEQQLKTTTLSEQEKLYTNKKIIANTNQLTAIYKFFTQTGKSSLVNIEYHYS